MDYKKIYKRKLLWLCGFIGLIIIIKVLSANTNWVENIYSQGIYIVISKILRWLFGWLPFSIGDVLYLSVIIWVLWKIIRLIIKIYKKRLNRQGLISSFLNLLLIVMAVYIVFNFLWGMNYNRKSINSQTGLALKKIDTADLNIIQGLLLQKVNESKQALIRQNAPYPDNKELFERAFNCYQQAEKIFPFLVYKKISVKSSLFSWWGNYFGFTGYYNPFTGEAQVNTKVPKFILPYTTSHEIAHQLGYAKEDEANFVGYLAATASSDTLFHYSTYLDLFLYANRQIFYTDSLAAKAAVNNLLTPVKKDIRELKEFYLRHKNPFEPIIRWAYGKYLKANEQPKGINSYNEVIADLIAFYKKYGRI